MRLNNGPPPLVFPSISLFFFSYFLLGDFLFCLYRKLYDKLLFFFFARLVHLLLPLLFCCCCCCCCLCPKEFVQTCLHGPFKSLTVGWERTGQNKKTGKKDTGTHTCTLAQAYISRFFIHAIVFWSLYTFFFFVRCRTFFYLLHFDPAWWHLCFDKEKGVTKTKRCNGIKVKIEKTIEMDHWKRKELGDTTRYKRKKTDPLDRQGK